ncbi:hypothetical protein BVRB_5g117800 [Beta vulgaris subsp. vulgaris]|nr:hypothetical protein BVRB_5g117800 [Beta vulgaris subsp. vulgaris]
MFFNSSPSVIINMRTSFFKKLCISALLLATFFLVGGFATFAAASSFAVNDGEPNNGCWFSMGEAGDRKFIASTNFDGENSAPSVTRFRPSRRSLRGGDPHNSPPSPQRAIEDHQHGR